MLPGWPYQNRLIGAASAAVLHQQTLDRRRWRKVGRAQMVDQAGEVDAPLDLLGVDETDGHGYAFSCERASEAHRQRTRFMDGVYRQPGGGRIAHHVQFSHCAAQGVGQVGLRHVGGCQHQCIGLDAALAAIEQ